MAFQIKVRRGEEHPLARLNNATRYDLYARYSRREATLRQLAEEVGVNPSSVWKIVNNPAWKTAEPSRLGSAVRSPVTPRKTTSRNRSEQG